MKNNFIVLFVLTFSAKTYSQTMSCCSNHASGMATFASNQKFVAAHLSPLPFTYQTPAGKTTSFPTPDGKTGSAYVVMSAVPTDNYLFVLHEWWGLNDYIKQRSDELQKALGNVNIVAVDMYDGKATSDPKVAAEYMKGADNIRVQNIIKGAIAFAGKKAHIYSMGWCFGGGYSLQTAILSGTQANGCVMYYGMPETDISKLKTLNCEVLGLFAEKDEWITPEVVKLFQKNMKTAGKKLSVNLYPADHAFANPSNPHYDKAIAEQANAAAIKFFKERLR